MRLPSSWGVLACVLLTLSTPSAGAVEKVMPKVKAGDRFSYVTKAQEGAKDESKEKRPGFADTRGTAMVSPLPTRETVTIGDTAVCKEHKCVEIEVEQVLPPFVPGIKVDSFGKKIKALIDLQSGDVLDIRTTLTMGSSVSESAELRYQPESTVAEFYGPWMADLKDGYNQSFNIASSGEVRTFRVSNREKIAGHDCFVVERIRHLPSNQSLAAKLWVDVQRRVALRVEQEGQIMSLEQ